MYKTKKEVDAHVRNALSKLRSETERHLRSFTIAKFYYKINEYSTAEQYLCSYLSVKEDNDQAHKLLGQCYQRLKKADKALQSFQRSLQLNAKQPDVLVDVCQLLLEDKNLNTNKAKYWCDLAESEKVQHDAVFSLRLKLMNKDNLETNQVEALIQKEISARPNDVQLRVRLVRNYIEQNKVLDAFKYIYNLEMGENDSFANSSEWYNVVWLVLSKYEQMPNTKKDWEFWLMLAICLERQVYISFLLTSSASAMGGVTETANLLFNLDQYLFKITQLSDKLCAQRELVSLFLEHYRGQLLLHAVSLIFKRELLQNKNKWKETVKTVLPLLLFSCQIKAPDNKEPWMKHCDEQGRRLIQLWNREGSFRCAQVGRTLLSCIVDETHDKENATLQINNMLGNQPTLWSNCDELLAQIRQTCSDKQWRRNIFGLLFCNSDQKVKEQTSFLIKSTKLAEPIFELPTYADVECCEETAQYLKPQSLQHMVYLCLGNDNLAYVRAKYFSGLNFSTQNLAFCGAESLNQLDVETFLYASSLQAKRMLEVERETFDNYNSGNRNAAGKPRILPFVNLQAQLCTEEQASWWTAAYQVYKNLTTDNLAEVRANLQYGIEAVRGINGPKIDMIIVFKLGQIFVARAQDIVKPVEKSFLEARAENIYKYGLNMVKMNNKGVLEPFRKYFKYVKANSSAVERAVATAAEDAVSYLASRYFKKAQYEDLIDELAGVQLPFATYLQAEAYRRLDEANKTPKKTKRIYLDRASECLAQTLMLLKNTETDPNHPLNSIIHGELKRLQQAGAKYLNSDSSNFSSNFSPPAHNNSSAYEDAEDDFFADGGGGASGLPTTSGGYSHSCNRARRDVAVSPRNNELESLVKQMANTLSFVKEEIVDALKPEVLSMRKEITSLKDKISQLEDAMKKQRISTPPSRDDASHVLDDLYMIDDALQSQLYQQPSAGGGVSGAGGVPGVLSPYPPAPHQNQRMTPSAAAALHNAAVAAAYNNPMFNPNFPMNYYPPQPYMMPTQGSSAAAGAGALLGPRNPLSLPFMDNMNFNLAPTASLLQPPQDGRPSNLYGLLTQPQQNTTAPQLPQLPVPMSMSQILSSIQPTNTIVTQPQPMPSLQAQQQQPPMQFNKTLNNQPVEKGPPANVVITSSDPLPNPNMVSLQAHQPTLSVTIPSHHIKSSIVQTPETTQPAPTSLAVSPATGGGFTMGIPMPPGNLFLSFGGSSITPTSSSSAGSLFSSSSFKGLPSSTMPSTSISTTTFSFKPQVEQAAQYRAQVVDISDADEDTLNGSKDNSDYNRSGGDAEPEYDPRPDFKPIIPLPDEIVVKTGEEDEEVMFCYRAKLYRFVEKEWKERGTGDMKILKNKQGTSRILMRRELTHKICANHKITKEMSLTIPKNEKKCYIWFANDFADEKLEVEKFFVRFKLPETAQQFHDAFTCAQHEAEQLEKNEVDIMQPPPAVQKSAPPPFSLTKSGAMTNFATSTPSTKGTETVVQTITQQQAPVATATATNVSKTLFSGFNLAANKTPTSTAENKSETAKSSPFANFTFDKLGGGSTAITSTPAAAPAAVANNSPFANIFSNLNKTTQSPFTTAAFQSPLAAAVTSSLLTLTATTSTPTAAGGDTSLGKLNTTDDDDYVPTAQFNPVIPLPDLVEVSTGEENEIVLFEHRAKLLRFDKEAREWKERGIGNIKLLQDKNDVNNVRLVMRREQIHKLCCNQRLYKDTSFQYTKNSQTALTWAGQDYSENELITETLTVRFKAAEICKQFHEAILKAQMNMSSSAEEGNVNNEAAVVKKASEKTAKAEKAAATATPKGFGDAFKPKAGSWSCGGCYTLNTADKLYCVACETPKDDTVPKKTAPAASLLSTTTKQTFSFDFGNTVATSTTAADTASTKSAFGGEGFGSHLKAKPGSWTCQDCYLNNAPADNYCKACETPKNDTIPKKEVPSNILALSDPTQKFNFGFNAAGAGANDNAAPKPPISTTGFAFGSPTSDVNSEPAKLLFGSNAAVGAGDTIKSFSFGMPSAAAGASDSNSSSSTLSKATFSFNLQSKTMDTPTLPGIGASQSTAVPFSLDKKDFSFTLKPKSPGKVGKSPLRFGGAGGDAEGAEDDDADYQDEEENNTYFTPVIPLPDKIDVKTGEENEELLYVHRAKLYRFTDGEWKERGLGDVKILRHKETKKLRVVMRRDQVLKICLNHVLNEDVEYKRKDDKSWLFVVNDFSEGAVELDKFSLRFKTKEIAQAFMDAVKSALAGTAAPTEAGTLNNSMLNNTTVSIKDTSITNNTAAVNISDADKQIADRLKLPYEFFTAKPTCTGCRGCDPDKFEFPLIKSYDSFEMPEDSTDGSFLPMDLPALALPKQQQQLNRSFLKQSTLTSPATPATTGVASPAIATSAGGGNIFSGFGGPNSTAFTGLGGNSTIGNKPNVAFSFTAALNSASKTADEAKSGGFLFGNTGVSGGSIFGGTGADKKPVFGQAPTIFGNAKPSDLSTASAGDTTNSIFGVSGTANTTPNSGGGKLLFGSDSVTPLFGGVGADLTKSEVPTNDSSKSIFGISTSGTTTQNGNSLFGTASTFAGFSNNSTMQKPLFGSDTSPFGSSNLSKEQSSTAPAAPSFADLSSKAGVVDFASLAAKVNTTATPTVTKPGEKPSPGGFIGLTDQDAFSSFQNTGNNKFRDGNANESNKSVEGEGGADDENYDPHYDAIIELPSEIVVSTGEEEETKLFGERATLYRWDATNKEWKERGVGELKILLHSAHQTYRLLLRREQIYKLVLNHAIGSDFTFSNMNNNPKSFVWATLNYAESAEGELEKLAVRFKNVDIAERFSKQLKSCIDTSKGRTQEQEQD